MTPANIYHPCMATHMDNRPLIGGPILCGSDRRASLLYLDKLQWQTPIGEALLQALDFSRE